MYVGANQGNLAQYTGIQLVYTLPPLHVECTDMYEMNN